MIKIFLRIVSALIIIVGAHGLYASFNTWETCGALGLGEAGKLFFVVSIPSPVDEAISKMTYWGFQSIMMPLVTVGVGVLLWWLADNVRRRYHNRNYKKRWRGREIQ
jgi:hypothetical protein